MQAIAKAMLKIALFIFLKPYTIVFIIPFCVINPFDSRGVRRPMSHIIDKGHRPTETSTIERIDNTKGDYQVIV